MEQNQNLGYFNFEGIDVTKQILNGRTTAILGIDSKAREIAKQISKYSYFYELYERIKNDSDDPKEPEFTSSFVGFAIPK